ncbi:MAG: type II toxin-antitoxin system Phd/YefM family antitoxin [Rhodospirillales bacterium]|nr:type II toxin-antitoxin system Phd/YefM family antitoxin [Rhodospirillales bacterium]
MGRMSFTQIRQDLAETLNQVAYSGERVLIHRRDRDVAALVSIEDFELLQAIEDRLDVEAAERALADPDNQERIAWSDVKKALGLS